MIWHAGFRDPEKSPLIGPLLFGRFSVMIFFVLSGFVLALPFFNERAPSNSVFLIRRVCRIYFPYLAAMAMGFFVLGGSLLPIVLMAGTPPGVQPDPPTWSLVIEMRYSLIFPLLVFAVARTPALSILSAFAASAAFLVWTGGGRYAIGDSIPESLLVTLYFGSLFIAGIAVARYRDEIKSLSQAPLAKLWMACIAFVGIGLFYDLSLLVAAVLVVALVPVTPLANRAAGFPPLAWLGRVSYSLYLVHWIVQAALLRAIPCVPIAIALYLPVSFALAEIGYRCVERPSIALGRRLTQGFATSSG